MYKTHSSRTRDKTAERIIINAETILWRVSVCSPTTGSLRRGPSTSWSLVITYVLRKTNTVQRGVVYIVHKCAFSSPVIESLRVTVILRHQTVSEATRRTRHRYFSRKCVKVYGFYDETCFFHKARDWTR